MWSQSSGCTSVFQFIKKKQRGWRKKKEKKKEFVFAAHSMQKYHLKESHKRLRRFFHKYENWQKWWRLICWGRFFFFKIYYLKEKKVELSSSTLPKQAVRKTNASVISWSDGRRPGTRSVGWWARCRRDEVRTGNKKIGSLDNTIVTVNDGGRVLYLFNAPAD